MAGQRFGPGVGFAAMGQTFFGGVLIGAGVVMAAATWFKLDELG